MLGSTEVTLQREVFFRCRGEAGLLVDTAVLVAADEGSTSAALVEEGTAPSPGCVLQGSTEKEEATETPQGEAEAKHTRDQEADDRLRYHPHGAGGQSGLLTNTRVPSNKRAVPRATGPAPHSAGIEDAFEQGVSAEVRMQRSYRRQLGRWVRECRAKLGLAQCLRSLVSFGFRQTEREKASHRDARRRQRVTVPKEIRGPDTARIRELIAARGEKTRRVAATLEVTENYLFQLISGRRRTEKQQRRLAEYLGQSYRELFPLAKEA